MRVGILFLGLLSFVSAGASANETVDRADLQAAMQQPIEQSLIDGAILHLDTETGEVREAYSTRSRNMIFAAGDHVVFHADFRDKVSNRIPLGLQKASLKKMMSKDMATKELR